MIHFTKDECKIILSEKLKEVPNLFFPKKRIIKHWFNILNVLLFNGKLVYFNKVEIKKKYKLYAQVIASFDQQKSSCNTVLVMHNRFKCFEAFVNILAHEMVHLYQIQIEEPKDNAHLNSNHGITFKKWIPIFTKYNLILKESYDLT